MKTYYKEIDILKGIAIVMVIIGHSIIVYPINLNVIPFYGVLHLAVSSVHMPLFFFISGFCYNCVNYNQYLLKKIKRICIPYFMFSIFSVISNIIFPSFTNGDTNITEAILDIFIYGTEYWFLYTLFIIFLIFPTIEKLVDGTKKYFLIIFFLIIARLVILPEIFNLDNIILYLPYFMVGYLIRKNLLIIKENMRVLTKLINKFSLIFWFVFWISLVVVNYLNSNYLEDYYIYKNILIITTSAVGIIFWGGIIHIFKNNKILNFFHKCGKYSLQLYLLNGYLLVVSRTLIINILRIYDPFIIFIFNIFVTLIISYMIINTFIKKVKFLQLIFGIV